jgi:hypothetical protein
MMKECVHRKQIPLLPAKVNRYFFSKSRGITPQQKQGQRKAWHIHSLKNLTFDLENQ